MIFSANLSEWYWLGYCLHIWRVKRFLTGIQARFGLLVGMIEVYQRDFDSTSDQVEMMVVKLTHSSAFVLLVLLEKCMFSVFESFFEEKLLIFIGSFSFGFGFLFHFLENCFFVFAELLQLYIGKFAIIEKLVKNDVKILMSGVFVGNRFHLIGKIFNP